MESEAVPSSVRNATVVTHKSEGETFSPRHVYTKHGIHSVLCESFVFNSQRLKAKNAYFIYSTVGRSWNSCFGKKMPSST